MASDSQCMDGRFTHLGQRGCFWRPASLSLSATGQTCERHDKKLCLMYELASPTDCLCISAFFSACLGTLDPVDASEHASPCNGVLLKQCKPTANEITLHMRNSHIKRVTFFSLIESFNKLSPRRAIISCDHSSPSIFVHAAWADDHACERWALLIVTRPCHSSAGAVKGPAHASTYVSTSRE